MRGIAVSALLHGIFIAGCLALDAGTLVKPPAHSGDPVHIQPVKTPPDRMAVKS